MVRVRRLYNAPLPVLAKSCDSPRSAPFVRIAVEFNVIVTPAPATGLGAYNMAKRYSDFEPLHSQVSGNKSVAAARSPSR